MAKEILSNAEKLDLNELKVMLFAAESHNLPIYPAKGPCGGCDLVLKPTEVAKGSCWGCDAQHPNVVAEGPCGGCDVLKPR
jgi:hypothetical protein